MSAGTLSAQQLRSIVEEKWKSDSTVVAIGLHLAQPWKVPGAVSFDSWNAEVVRADTVFQVREALLDAERFRSRCGPPRAWSNTTATNRFPLWSGALWAAWQTTRLPTWNGWRSAPGSAPAAGRRTPQAIPLRRRCLPEPVDTARL